MMAPYPIGCVLLLLLAVMACGTSAAPLPVSPGSEGMAFRARPVGDDLVVAQVNGEPVYGSCVRAQAEGLGITDQQALDQCIGFELLADEARRRGLLGDPDAISASKREAVRAFLRGEFYGDHFGPGSLPLEDLRKMWEGLPESGIPLKGYFNHPELRAATYCRVPVARVPQAKGEAEPPPGVDRPPVPGSEEIGRALSAVIYASTIARDPARTIEKSELLAICNQLATTQPAESTSRIEAVDYIPMARSQLEKGFGDALFGLHAGEMSAPIYSTSGFFIIRLASITPERDDSFDEALPDLRALIWEGKAEYKNTRWMRELELYRRDIFLRWFRTFEPAHHVELFPEALGGDELASAFAQP
jgi:hypothetical protein